jgi:hypothetical protein
MLRTPQGRPGKKRFRTGVWSVSVRIPIFAALVFLVIAMVEVVKVHSARPNPLLNHVLVLNSAYESSNGTGHR